MEENVLWYQIFNTLTSIVLVCLLLQLLSVTNMLGDWKLPVIREMWKMPGPKCLPIVGNITTFWGTSAEVFQILRKLASQYPGYYKIWAMHLAAVNIYNPDDIETVLSSSQLITKSMMYNWIKPWLNEGLLTSKGEKWKLRRKLLTPAFHFNILREFVNIFEEHSLQTVELLRDECSKNKTNVIPFVTDFAIHTLCETTMGCKVDPGSSTVQDYKAAIHRYAEILVYRILHPWLYSDVTFSMTAIGVEVEQVLKTLHKFTSDIIHKRLRTWDENSCISVDSPSGKKRLAMLDLLIWQMKHGANIDIDGIHEEVDTFMFEGHDTTSMGLSFFLLLLANHSNVQERIASEVQAILGEDGHKRKATYKELQSMVYLEMCIKESLRIYPSVPVISRLVTSEFKIKDHRILPGVIVYLQLYDLHHDPKLWPNPERFDPDRFLPENTLNRHPFSYVPFSAGPRNCIGQKFALLEMKSFISKILLEYVLEPIDTQESIVINTDMVLRPRNGVHVRFRKRHLL